MSVHRAAVDMWERFWFEQISTDVYRLLRTAFGVVGVLSLYGLTPVSTYWTVDGLATPAPNVLWLRRHLVQYGVDSVAGWMLFLTLLAAFSLMIVGRWSRAAVAVAFFGSAVQSRWNPLPLFGAHAVLLSVLFPLIWADTTSPAAKPDSADERHGNLTAIWPLRLIRLQICVIYLSSGLWKLLADTWRDGSAMHYILNRNVFPRFAPSYPPAVEPALTVATYATLVWELTFPLCMLNRWTRYVALSIGVVMHLGMAAFLELGPFSLVMLTSYLAFIDPAATRDTLRWFMGGARNRVIVRSGV
jgi:hypothetical protein